MAVEIFGKVTKDLPNAHPTIGQLSDYLRKTYPDIWRNVGMRHVEPPPGYVGLGVLANTICAAHIQSLSTNWKNPAVRSISFASLQLQKHDYPTFFVGKQLFESMRRTRAPELKWSDVVWPFPAVTFMLPHNAVIEQPSGLPVHFVSVAHLPVGWFTPTPGARKIPNDNERVSIFWGIESGYVLQHLTMPIDQLLQPSEEWLEEATRYSMEYSKAIDAGFTNELSATNEFSIYMAGLAANFLLLMSARVNLVEHGTRTGKKLKSGAVCHTPSWLGRKYETARKYDERSTGDAGGHYTELGWRSGYFGKRLIGHGRTESRIVWVDPYIAYTRGLVRPATEEEPKEI